MSATAQVQMKASGGAAVVAALTAMGGQVSDIARRVGLVILARQYGAPARLEDDTPWHEIGSDSCRMLLVIEAEQRFSIEIGDEEREAIQTFGDLIALVRHKQGLPA